MGGCAGLIHTALFFNGRCYWHLLVQFVGPYGPDHTAVAIGRGTSFTERSGDFEVSGHILLSAGHEALPSTENNRA